MLYFNHAQTFFLDRSSVQNASEVALTRIDLYFRAKPPATNNKSGIYKPGVELKIVPCMNGIPVINQMGAYRPSEPTEHGAKFNFYSGGQTARVEYDEILASGNAGVPTQFLFPSPVFVPTNAEYGVVIKFDGSENFVLWTSVTGDELVGTHNISHGPSGNFRGTLFSFIDDPNKTASQISNATYAYTNTAVSNTVVSNNQSLVYGATVYQNEGWDTRYLQSSWTPLMNEWLKLDIHVARYFINGVPVITLPSYVDNNAITSAHDRIVSTAGAGAISNGIFTLTAPVQTTEYISYDVSNSVRDYLFHGAPFFQNGPPWPSAKSPLPVYLAPGGNTQDVSANATFTLPNGVTFNNSGGFSNLVSVGNYIILKEANTSYVYVRQVVHVNSNTSITVDQAFPVTANASLYIAPVGYLQEVKDMVLFGKKTDLMTLYGSSANTTVRFTSYSVANVTINNGGTGYSNNDYIKVLGFEDIAFSVKGNYSAFANITTNASGVITNVYFSNTGAGFNNTALLVGANVSVLQSSGGTPSLTPSVGTGANLTLRVGSSLGSSLGNTTIANCEVVNLEVQRMKPEITINNPVGSGFSIRHRTLFHSINDSTAHLGKAYYVDTPAESANTDTVAKIFKAHTLDVPDIGKTPVLTSRSNEMVIRYADGQTSNSSIIGSAFSNTAVFLFDISSNSDYQAVWFDPEVVVSHYGRYIINEDYTNEHTNFGNAVAKHVATKVNLASNAFAEDILVYLTAYKPANSDIKVYARVHNAADPDAFDDTDWSLLELVDGMGFYSSTTDDANYIELTYNLPAYPNTDFTMTGTVTLYQGNVHVTGSGTHFGPNTAISAAGAGYANGDVVSFTAPTAQNMSNGNIFAWKASVNATYIVGTNPSGNITSIVANNLGYGWVNQDPITSFTVANSTGGNSTGTGASFVFNPGLQTGDLIKIYSPYTDWANTNYTIAVVNNVVSNTDLTVMKTLGDLTANLQGNVNIQTTTTTLDGQATFFNIDFSVGDFIAIWANSSTYEVHKVVSITDANTIIMDSNGTFTNTATFYAKVLPDRFMNVSLTVSNLKIDRLAYRHQAFNNIGNDNVARYYNSSMMEFDAFDTIQIKVVLLSDEDSIIPKVDDVRGMMVTA